MLSLDLKGVIIITILCVIVLFSVNGVMLKALYVKQNVDVALIYAYGMQHTHSFVFSFL